MVKRSKSKPRSSFDEKCYRILSTVPRGRVTTYREIGRALGTKAYRAVGNAMGRNPYAPRVPCHRVVKVNGDIGGFMHGPKRKAELLRREGVAVAQGRVIDFKKHLYQFR